MTQQTRNTCPTQWDSVNDLMDGGLIGGELGVVVVQHLTVLVRVGH